MKLLADSSAILAQVLRADRNHAAATGFMRRNRSARLVLTDLILGEVVTRTRAWTGSDIAVALGRDLLSSRQYDIVFVDTDLIESALSRMAQYSDKRLSLTDCTSFELIERLGLDGAFTFDADFRNCGFRMLPG